MAAKNLPGPTPPVLKHRQYSDGALLDEIHYLECKLILKPERFTSVKAFQDYGDLVRRAADALDIGHDVKCVAGMRPSLREVMFLDTADFRLYNNSFILRQRRQLLHAARHGLHQWGPTRWRRPSRYPCSGMRTAGSIIVSSPERLPARR